jgi:hypothetical protein
MASGVDTDSHGSVNSTTSHQDFQCWPRNMCASCVRRTFVRHVKSFPIRNSAYVTFIERLHEGLRDLWTRPGRMGILRGVRKPRSTRRATKR